jgi:hypothetical protein
MLPRVGDKSIKEQTNFFVERFSVPQASDVAVRMRRLTTVLLGWHIVEKGNRLNGECNAT